MIKISKVALALWCLSAATITTTQGYSFVGNNHARQRCLTPALTAASPSFVHPATVTSSRFATTLSMSSVEVDINNPPPSKITFLPESAVEVTVTAPAAATKAAYEKTALELSKTISIPGFRKGAKIAPQVLESHMASKGGRNAIRVEAIKALLAKLVDIAVKEEHKLDPIGQPVTLIPLETLAESFVPGKDFTMGVKCDVWPTLKWAESEEEKPYHGLSGKYSRKPYDETKFNLAMKDLRDRYAVLEDMPDGTKLDWGDACTVNMVGYMSNDAGDKLEPLPNAASGENVEVVLGKGRYMEGLVEGLVGAAVGETKTVQTAFPERLKDKTLAGKKAVFDVSILQSSTRKLPELDDEFANDVRPGMDIKTLRDELQKAVDEEDAKEFVEDRNKALSEALATRIDIEMPDSILVNQAREKYAEMMTDFRTNGMSDEEIQKLITPENFLKYKNIVKPGIVNDFKVTLGTEEIAKLENVEVPAYRVDEQMASLKKESEQSGEEFDEAQVRPRVENTLQRRMVFDYLAENGNLEVEFKDEEGGEGFDAELMDTLAKESIAREEALAIELEEKNKAEAAAAAAADAESDQGKQQQTVDDSGNGGGAAAKLEEEAKAVVEAETKAKAEEEARIVAEAKAKDEEEARIASEKAAAEAKAEEEARIAAEAKAKAEEEARIAAEAKAKAEEEARIASEKAAAEAKAKAEEKARIAAEAKAKAEAEAKAKAEEEARIAADKAAAEAKAKAEEEARVAAEAKAKAEAEAKAKAEEEARIASEKAAAEAKAKAEEEARVAAEKAAAEAKAKAEAEAKAKAEEEARIAAEKAAAEAKAKAEEEARIAAEEEARRNTPEYKYYAKLEARKAAIEDAWKEKTEQELEAIEAKYNAIEDIPTRVFTVLCDLGLAEEEGLDEDHPDYWDGLDDEIVPMFDVDGNWVTEWPEEPKEP